MKRYIYILTLFLFSIKLLGQSIQKSDYSKEYYLDKSKSKKTTAFILLGSGFALTVIGATAFESAWNSESNSSTDVKGTVMLGGVGLLLTSIPFLISSGNNSRKAASISLNNQNFPVLKEGSYVLNSSPCLSLKLNF